MRTENTFKRLTGILGALSLGLGLLFGFGFLSNHLALAQFAARPALPHPISTLTERDFDTRELWQAKFHPDYPTESDYKEVTTSAALEFPELILWVNYDHDWVQGPYEVGHTAWLTVTNSAGTVKATAEVTTTLDPNGSAWTGFNSTTGNPWQPENPDIQPGDFVYGKIDTGYTATVQVGQITGIVDVESDGITGTVDVPWLMPGPVDIECHPWGASGGAPWKYDTVTPDGNDTFSCAWDPGTEWDVQPGQNIAVIYHNPAGHLIYGVFYAPVWDLRLSTNYGHDWVQGNYEPGYTVWVTVTDGLGAVKATAVMSTAVVSEWGNWTGFSTQLGNPWQPEKPNIEAGDFVYGAVSNGYTATVQLGHITGAIDVDTDSITGTLDASWLMPGPVDVQCHTWGAPSGAPHKWDTVIPDGSDVYSCTWDPATEWDVLPGQDLGVSYFEPGGHEIFNAFYAPKWDLILRTNYAHDWVEGNYEPGYTVWLTITDSLGALKAVARMETGEIPWWNGNTGFSTNDGNPWHPERPDIQAGDFIYGAVSSGYTATVHLGTMTGFVDIESDSITGTVDAPWLPAQPLDIECHAWGAPNGAPNKRDTAIPDGNDTYACAWDPNTEWDVGPGQEIGVSYQEPAGHQVLGGFRSRHPVMQVNYGHEWVQGNYEPGHTIWITVTNDSGGVKASAVLSTVVMPPDWGNWAGFSTNMGDPWQPERPDIEAGDFVFARVDNGYTGTAHLGTITGFLDVDVDAITGTIDAPWLMPGPVDMQCHPWGAPYWTPNKSDSIIPDGNDTYACTWDTDTEWDILPGQDVAVSYFDSNGHEIFDVYQTPVWDLIMSINYAHDWVEGNYEPGYTLWLTVTNAIGDLKATATLTTGVIPWWGGDNSGFSTNLGEPWSPEHPDLQPGDIVHGMLSNGYSATVELGQIAGFIDVDADTITGTVDAPWLLPEVLDIQCEPWIWPNWAPGKNDTVSPDGNDTYTCAWDPNTEWDIQYGHDIGVAYREPAGHWVYGGFHAADYNLHFTVNLNRDRIEGPYEPGYTVWLTVTNSGGAVKATIETQSEGMGFSSEIGEWQPERPDIAPGDRIYGLVENGYSASMQVGGITGIVDLDADSITGAAGAAWLMPGPVNVECYAWDAPDWIPHKFDSVTPDGADPYSCAWDPATEWDLKAGQTVAVVLSHPEGHQTLNLFNEFLEPPAYGLDAIVGMTEPSLTNALARLETGELSIYAAPTNSPEAVAQIAASPNLEGYLSYGQYNELTFNPSGPIFPGTGKLNPFAVPRIREAMNWLVDREAIRQEIMSGMSTPRWLPLNTASRDYTLLADVARGLELTYRHDKTLAQQVIAQEMLALGASRVDNQWIYNGEPVELILLIRVEDHRMPIGDYVADELESIGFTVDRQYKRSGEASAIWVQTDPTEGRFHIYTGGWITTEVARDLSDNFAFFYTDMGLNWPLWQAYTPTPEFYELARQLRDHEFASFEERRMMMAQALEWAMEDSVRIWVHDNLSITPRRAEVSYASDAVGGINGSWLWPHTLERTGTFTRSLNIGIPALFQEPWNPLNGSSALYDMTFIHATSDNGVVPDPYNGLVWSQRIAGATVVAEAGLPISRTLDWVTLQFAPSIVIPADAWVDWDPATEHFLTAAEVYTQPQSVQIKSVVTYPPNLFTTVTWHDGSPFSIADVVLNMILSLDRDWVNIRGVRIISQNPLIIETYTDAYQIDAERNVITWWPTYSTGPGAWHTLALGLLVEANREGAFTQWEADEWGVPWMDYAAWPGSIPLERRLATAQAQAFIPYAPTLGAYITTPQAQARWNALAAWYTAHGHFWIGTGPLYLDRVLKPIGQLALQPYPAYPDAPDRWDAFAEAPLAEVAITGPNSVPQGVTAAFDVQVILAGAPYPTADIESVRYLLTNARNEVALTGDAMPVTDGLWRVTLTAAQSTQLPLGGNELEVIVSSKRIAIAAVATHAFETTGIRVLGVTPNSGVNDAPIVLTIGGRQFQAGAIAALVRDGAAQQLAIISVSDTSVEAIAPAGLPAGTYAVRVINPDGKSDTLLGGFTLLTRTAPVITGLSPQQGPNNIPITLDIYGSNFGTGLVARLGAVLLEDITLVDSTHIRAVVPLNITPGVYTLIITNLDGQGAQLTNAYTALASIDDLYPREGSFWLDPVTLRQGEPITPALGIVVNRLGGTAVLPNVPVDFFYQPTSGSAILIGRANTPPLAPNSQAGTLPLAWTNLPTAGTYTLRAVIDPANAVAETVETNNVFTRTVIILPPLPDTIPPVVQSFSINTGEQHTAQRQVYFNVTAEDNTGGSGVTSLLYIEYVYIHSRGDWVPVATSGWLPYAEASAAYPWLLNPIPGVHYLRAWAADAAGNISLYWRAGFINLVPGTTPASIARGLVHTYRFYFQTGQSLSLDLTSVNGDADVYVFAPDDSLITHSFSENPVEGVSFTATRNGVYQVEIFGYVASNYTLEFTLEARAQSPGQHRISSSKTPRDAPLVSAGDSPEGEGYAAGVPSAPATPAGPVCVAVTGISFTYLPSQPLVNTPITFNAVLAPTGATLPITLTWTFGDGQTATGHTNSVTHTYTTSGDKAVEVRVVNPCTSSAGLTARQALTIKMRQVFLPLVMRSFP